MTDDTKQAPDLEPMDLNVMEGVLMDCWHRGYAETPFLPADILWLVSEVRRLRAALDSIRWKDHPVDCDRIPYYDGLPAVPDEYCPVCIADAALDGGQ